MTIRVRVLRIINPTNYLTYTTFRNSKALVNIVQEKIAICTKPLISIVFLSTEEHQIIIRILLPIRISFVKEASVYTVLFIFYDRNYSLGFLSFSVFVYNGLFYLLSLNAVFQFTIRSFAITFSKAFTITLKALIECRICSCKCNIPFTKNIVRRQNPSY